MNCEDLEKLFNIGRPITKDSNFPYIHLAYEYKLSNYRLITSGELIVRGKDIDIPDYIIQFVLYNNEVLMIAGIISGKVVNITFRTITGNKEFMKLGNTKGIFYGLGDLDSDFRYGDPIILVEGHLDRDVMSCMFYKNTLAIMTNQLSKIQVKLLEGLTNNIILMLDNDEAGRFGTNVIKRQLKGFRVNEIMPYLYIKDAGDIIKIKNKSEFNDVCDFYRNQLSLYLEGN
jgi:5S rRNA maturation endonuclease (ribonuclease M5)